MLALWRFVEINGAIGAMLLPFIVFIIWLTIGRYFDKKFPKFANDPLSIENYYYDFKPLGRFMRAMRYYYCIIFRNYSLKSSYCKSYFKDYDFRKNARPIDLVVAYTCFPLTVFIFSLLIIGFCLHYLLGYK